MKRIALIVAVLLWGATTTIARPVDRMMAESAATRFAVAQFAMERGDMTPVLAYTEPQGAYYIFNFGNHGFVIIAADDAYRPVIGYSNESAFDVNNIPPALAAHLDGIAQHILALRAEGHAEADPMVAADWAIGGVDLAINVDGVAPKHLIFGLLIHDDIFLEVLPFKRVPQAKG